MVENSTIDNRQSPLDEWSQWAASMLYLYCTPLVMLVGVVGNALILYVLGTPDLPMQSTRLYLRWLAVADIVFLSQLLPPWLSAMGLWDGFGWPGVCQFVTYASYASSFTSTWLVVTFTLERLVAVRYPLHRSVVCTLARARAVAAGLLTSALTFSLPVLLFSATDGVCSIDPNHLVAAAIFNTTDTILSYSVPLCIIITCNAGIGCALRLSRGIQDRYLRVASAPIVEQSLMQRRMTWMLIIASSFFVALNLPAYVLRLLAYYNMIPNGRFITINPIKNSGEISGRWLALQQISVLLFHSSYAVNFYLYCFTSQTFRRALYNRIPWLRPREAEVPVVMLPLNRPGSPHPIRFQRIVTSDSFESHPSYAAQNQATMEQRRSRQRLREQFEPPTFRSSSTGTFNSHQYLQVPELPRERRRRRRRSPSYVPGRLAFNKPPKRSTSSPGFSGGQSRPVATRTYAQRRENWMLKQFRRASAPEFVSKFTY